MASAKRRGAPGDGDRRRRPPAREPSGTARHRRHDRSVLTHPTPWALRARRTSGGLDVTPPSGTPSLDTTVAPDPGWYDTTGAAQPGWYDTAPAPDPGWHDSTSAAQPGWHDTAPDPAPDPGWHDTAPVADPGWYATTSAAQPGWHEDPEPVAAPATATPVFVDDSGRRRRWGRIVGVCLGVVVLAYVGLVGLTFAGVQLAGTLVPGVDGLSDPGEGPSGTGAGARETPLPPAAFDPQAVPADGWPGARSASGPDTSPAPTQPPGTPTSAPTTTTTAPGGGSTTTVPSPNSTVPDHTPPSTPGGPPDEPPGKP